MDESGHLTLLNVRSVEMACALVLLVAVAVSGNGAPLRAQQAGVAAGGQGESGYRTLAAPPDSDQARGVDAELRLALFDLASNRPLTALNRLEWLRSSAAMSALDSDAGSGAAPARPAGDASQLRSRADLLFLLAEGYNRLDMAGSFREAATALAAAPGGDRYAAIIGSQLMLDAYRRGEYQRVRELAAGRRPAGGSGVEPPLATLLSGLAAYQTGDFAGARTAFATIRAEGGVYAPYAQLMDALALMRGDTTRATEALGALRSLAQLATGTFGDHVRLVAAELAYESGQYTTAVSNAHGVGAETGLAAQALLTEGWASYRAGELDAARAAFAAFASRYWLLPERDEARLMAGQMMLEAGDAAQAEAYFQAMADSVAAEAALLKSRTASTLSDGARALVASRAAGIAFLGFPHDGKTLELPQEAASEMTAVLAAFAGSPAPAARTSPRVVSVADIEGRLLQARPALGADFPRRILFAAASGPSAESYAARAQLLADADVRVALANYQVREQLDAHAMKISALEELQRLIALSRVDLATEGQIISVTRDSLSQMRTVLARGRERVLRAVQARIAQTRQMAAENRLIIDSVRASLGASANDSDRTLLGTEVETAAAYDRLAAIMAGGLDSLIDRHPVLALADSVAGRLRDVDMLRGDARSVLATDSAAASEALASLRARESERTTAARDSLGAAESRRAAAERALIELVDADLNARALALATELQRDQEAAEYGSASAAFFRVTEGDGAPARGQRTSGSEP